MSLDGSYDENNPFALILTGKLPAHGIYEDAETLAFLDIMPQAEGHALVISKTSRARNILEIEDDAMAAVMRTVRRVAVVLNTLLGPDGLQIVQFNGAAAGQTVFHLHVHIIPRRQASDGSHIVGFRAQPPADHAALALLAERIRAAI